jgi:uncharacterized surface protein with fasciclin (FAS1) repeats
MRLIRFIAAASAAALIVSPVAALAQGAAMPPPPAAAAEPQAPALPSVPKITGGADIYDTLKAAGEFTILLKALDQAGLAPVLQRTPNLTFFAPTDQAFAALPPDMMGKLMAPNDTAANQLQQILKYLLINAQVDASKIRGAKGPVMTVEGKPVELDGSNPEDLKVNDADIIQTDIRTTNGGLIHVLDKVLIPSDSPYATASAAAPAATP